MHIARWALQSLLLLPFFTTPCPAQDPTRPLKEKKRVLLVFASASTDPNFKKQYEFLNNQATEIADRDLIVIPVLARWQHSDDSLFSANRPYTSALERTSLRKRYKIQLNTFIVILLGKDGGEKLRSPNPVPINTLTDLIDSMPMRQQEMRDRHPR